MKHSFITILGLCATVASLSAQPRITQEHKDKAAEIVSRMTLEEKCAFISGYRDNFYTYPVERLGISEVLFSDGPQGVRSIGFAKENSTYYPCGIAVAASWNRSVAREVGYGIGQDALARGISVMLCPGVNIYRNPRCGRNFEYYGEDPYLAGEQAVGYINGMQEQKVMATIKHFAANNQEYERYAVSSNVDERTLNEIYFPVFRKAVENGVGAIMTSYNPLNGTHTSENPWLTVSVLRERWGFDGIVMSDWVSTYSPIGCVNSGLDLEMPLGYAMNYNSLKPLLDEGVIEIEQIDEKCRHLVQTYLAFECFGRTADASIPRDNPESHARAYQAAVEAPVLLKNEGGILPLKKGKKILLIGPNADHIPHGGGSGSMYPFPERCTTLYKGLKSLGCNVEYRFEVPSRKSDLEDVEYIIAAMGFDYPTEKENADRTYTLPGTQDREICDAVKTGKKVIVVANSGGEFDLSKWGDKVDAIIMAWYAGQEGGRAIADILTGKVSPSGRLPFTFWGSLEKNPSEANYGVKILDSSMYTTASRRERYKKYPYADYSEGVFVGYRGVEHFDIKPLYPFGYGLTYSDFEYSDIKVERTGDASCRVSFVVRNAGSREAAEVAQVYVAPVNPSVVRPARELKGYEKVFLKKGESRVVTIDLGPEAFSYYSRSKHDWAVDSVCNFVIEVGASSGDIRLMAPL